MDRVLIGSIPAPPPGLPRLYGAMVALGILVGVWLAFRRWTARGGTSDDIWAIAMWSIPAGIIGARLYHVVTDFQLYRDDPITALYVWNGGLGIPGGVLFGVLMGMWVGHCRGVRVPVGLDAIAPAMPLAQAIGRWGNYFNQELYGSPTTLPWGLHIDPAFRPPGFLVSATYHPAFLYEMLWNVGLVAALILIDRRRVLRPGRLFALYILGYFVGRLWVEALRVDPANTFAGLRVNTWLSLVCITAVLALFVISGLRRRPDADMGIYRDPGKSGMDDSDAEPGDTGSPERPGRQDSHAESTNI